MKKRTGKREIIKEAERMIKEEKVYIEEVENNKNPQVVELKHKAEGKIEALEDLVQFAILGR